MKTTHTSVSCLVALIASLARPSSAMGQVIESLTVVPGQPTTSDVVSFDYTGYIPCVNWDVVGLDVIHGAGEVIVEIGYEVEPFCLPAIIVLDNVLPIGVLSAGAYTGTVRLVEVDSGMVADSLSVGFTVVCAADANDDGVVDELDLNAVIDDWDTDGSVNGGDVNGDGIVDVDDIVEVILAWGSC